MTIVKCDFLLQVPKECPADRLRSMKPAWDKLMEAYKNDESILVADVDCIGTGKSKCDEVGVKGFPTIKQLGSKWIWQNIAEWTPWCRIAENDLFI